MAGDPRSTAQWQRLRATILATATHCAMCGHPLDPDAPPRTRWASTVDHIRPLDQGGAPFDAENCRPAHYGCNATAGARQTKRNTPRPRTNVPPPSREW